MNTNIFKKHDPTVFRNILLSFSIMFILLNIICFISILKNLFLTFDVLAHHDITFLFHRRISELFVFSVNSLFIYVFYWIIFTALLIFPIWFFSFFKAPQYLLKIMMMLSCSFMLAYFYTDLHFFSYTHRHIHEIWSNALFKSPFFNWFIQSFVFFLVSVIIVLILAENFYFKYSLHYLKPIILSLCCILFISYSVYLYVQKFQDLKPFQTYIQHYIGLNHILQLEKDDNFIYVENGPTISNNSMPKSISSVHNIIIIGIKNLTQQNIKRKNIPSISQFQNENLNFTKHISSGITETENLFGLLYGLPLNYLPTVLYHQTKPFLLQALQKNDYKLFAENQHELSLFYNEKLPTPSYPETIFNSNNKQPFFIFYQLSIDTHHPLVSYANIEEKINHLLPLLKSTRQYSNTIVIITGLTAEKGAYTPFMMHWPQIDTPQTIRKVSSDYDIVSTLLSMDQNSSFGLNLFALKRNRTIPAKVGSSLSQVFSESNKIYVKPFVNYSEYQTLLKY